MTTTPLASRLEGKTIDDKWEVMRKRIKTEDDHSGAFSSCYEVKNIENGEVGFLKAINYAYAFKATGHGTSSTVFLQELTQNYNYEKDLLEFCRDNKMSRIVSAIAHGEYRDSAEMFPVPYLVFETATGSLKNVKRQKQKQIDLAWKLGVIHGFLVGLSQLHQEKIVHQDIKPSNILIFGHNVSKLGDLGNATKFDNKSPMWDNDGHCGDFSYAHIELLYRYFSPDWNTIRLGADLFMAGGIISYMITDSNFLSLLAANIPDIYKPTNFGGTFEDVKPHLMQAYNKTIAEIKDRIDEPIRKDIIEIIAQFTHPVPELRGIPKGFNNSLPQYSLWRCISIIDRLAKKVEMGKI
ncbi:MAG: protein kinase [Candidatus Schekmanbacteria bacterium]|nr:protein kinase [Candidatus Schekmanbacteria bacterium]